MLSFVIPLISAAVSRDWSLTQALVRRTLRSALSQFGSARYRVVLVCHEVPEALPNDLRLHIESVDFDLQLSSSDPPFHTCPEIERRETDKGRKLLRGLALSRALGASHIMLLDADDLVCNRIAEVVQRHPSHTGWRIEQGYSYREGSDRIRFKPWGFHRQCGTGLIVREDLLQQTRTASYTRGLRYYRQLLGHDHLADDLARAGSPLRPFPLAGAVYVQHAINHRHAEFLNGSKWWTRTASEMRRRIFEQPLTAELRERFQLHELSPSEISLESVSSEREVGTLV